MQDGRGRSRGYTPSGLGLKVRLARDEDINEVAQLQLDVFAPSAPAPSLLPMLQPLFDANQLAVRRDMRVRLAADLRCAPACLAVNGLGHMARRPEISFLFESGPLIFPPGPQSCRCIGTLYSRYTAHANQAAHGARSLHLGGCGAPRRGRAGARISIGWTVHSPMCHPRGPNPQRRPAFGRPSAEWLRESSSSCAVATSIAPLRP